jgi:alanine racemase
MMIIDESMSRRDFVRCGAASALVAALPGGVFLTRTDTYEPWLEIDANALANNVRVISRIAGGRPLIAVVKNNAYGISLNAAGPIIAKQAQVSAMAVVKRDEAEALIAAGVTKPILLMALVDENEAVDLVRRGVQLGVYDDGAPRRLQAIARRLQKPVPIHFYIDTGISRVGMPYHRALPWMEEIQRSRNADVQGTFMAFTENDAFDAEQLQRFGEVTNAAKSKGIMLGRLHASSSHALFRRPEAHLDAVRTGLVLYGAYPSEVRNAMKQTAQPQFEGLTPAFRLRARVVRVEHLRAGDSVSYGRNYIASKPTWTATLPVGHADGYPRNAVKGCTVLIRDRLYPVIGAVSASHTIVEVGDEKTVEQGDVGTLVGPDRPEIHPNAISEKAGNSVYDVLMHLSARLPTRIL